MQRKRVESRETEVDAHRQHRVGRSSFLVILIVRAESLVDVELVTADGEWRTAVSGFIRLRFVAAGPSDSTGFRLIPSFSCS